MRAVDVIIRKRDRFELTRDEIEYFIQGFIRGEIQDYQASAFDGCGLQWHESA